ncbi:MAG: copper oxidase [Methylococcaceae bacterium]|nr:copper oxidase [Methylococcaceae bacterium]
MGKIFSIAVLMVLCSVNAVAKEYEKHTALMNHGDGHLMDMGGAMVMGQNTDTLPGGCDEIAYTKEITVHAGHKYAEKFPGRMWAFDAQEYNFEPCTKLTVHFINDDNIRHQWMMHGLPKYLYAQGMFHLEVSGPGEVSGTLILPPGDQTYLVHCDMAQHMEKGLKAQLKVGKGSGDLPSIPGITANIIEDNYNESMPPPVVVPVKAGAAPAKPVTETESVVSGTTIIGLAMGLVLAPFLGRKLKGMSIAEIIAYCFELISLLISKLFKLISALTHTLLPNKAKQLPK